MTIIENREPDRTRVRKSANPGYVARLSPLRESRGHLLSELSGVHHAAKPDMPGRRVRRRGRARRVAVAPAVRRVAQETAAAHGAVFVVEPVVAPLPAIADDVVEAEVVLPEGIDRREAVEAVGLVVVARERALP